MKGYIMRTGSEIYDILANKEHNENVARFTNLLRDEMNGETLVVGTYIIVRDLGAIISATGPTMADMGFCLEKRILDNASAWSQYAGFPYDEDEWELNDNGELPPVEDGLRWVGFTDIMATLNQVADSYK